MRRVLHQKKHGSQTTPSAMPEEAEQNLVRVSISGEDKYSFYSCPFAGLTGRKGEGLRVHARPPPPPPSHPVPSQSAGSPPLSTSLQTDSRHPFSAQTQRRETVAAQEQTEARHDAGARLALFPSSVHRARKS